MAYFPFMIEIENKKCLVVGGGSIAFHKVKLLYDFGVHIRVVGIGICKELREWAEEKRTREISAGKQPEEMAIEMIQREFRDSDIDGIDFVVAATDDETLNDHISDLCSQRKLLVNVVDRKEACSFIFPAMIQNKDLLVAISTGGQSPAAAAYVKRQIKNRVPEYYGDMVEILGEYRDYIFESVKTAKERKEIFNRLLEYGDSHEGEIPLDIVKQTMAEVLE